MAKTKTVFFCTNCGNESLKWMGRCPSCGAFNTMQEHIEKPVASGRAKVNPVGNSRTPQRLRDVTTDREIRFADGQDFAAYEGTVIRLRFRMFDARLYSLYFA